MCNEDSDGDGRTNGVELGDPSCTWNATRSPQFNATSHPGFKDPVDQFPYNASDETTIDCANFNTMSDKCSAALNESGVLSKDFLLPSGQRVPSQETTYRCHNVLFPSDRKYHVSAVQAQIDNLNVAHHVNLFGCVTPVALMGSSAEPYDCLMPPASCGGFFLLAMWAFGFDDVTECFPPGFPAAPPIGPGSFLWGVLQVHWNNPLRLTNQTDASGLRLYYTPHLRTHDMGTLAVGHSDFFIPPGQETVTLSGSCRFSDCVSANYNSEPIRIVSDGNHMHELGRIGKSVLYRANDTQRQFPITLAYDNPFAYDRPVLHEFDTPIVVYPGDEIDMTCTYSSTSRDVVTFSGDATRNEMCVAIFRYYPQSLSVTGSYCFTAGTIDYCNVVQFSSPSFLQSIFGSVSCNVALFSQALLSVVFSPCFISESVIHCLPQCVPLFDAIFSDGCMACNSSSRAKVEEQLGDNEMFQAYRRMRQGCTPSNYNVTCGATTPVTTDAPTKETTPSSGAKGVAKGVLGLVIGIASACLLSVFI